MKKIIKLIIAISLIAFGSVSALSANPLDYDDAIGIFGMSETDAGGLQYQKWFNDKIGLQLTGFGSYVDYNSYEDSDVPDYSLSLSAELLLNLYASQISENTAVRLYGWGLVGYYGANDSVSIYETVENEDGTTSQKYTGRKDTGLASNMTVGLGFGFDFMFLKHISIPVEFGFGGKFPGTTGFGFCAGTGLRFRF